MKSFSIKIVTLSLVVQVVVQRHADKVLVGEQRHADTQMCGVRRDARHAQVHLGQQRHAEHAGEVPQGVTIFSFSAKYFVNSFQYDTKFACKSLNSTQT